MSRPPHAAPELVVRAEALVKRFGAKVAVDGLDLSVRRGELFGLLGPNGAGKSTAMFMITGLARPTGGKVEVFGRSPNELAGARARIGALIETPAFYPYLSGRRNLRMLARLSGMNDERAIDAALDRVGLLADANRKAGQYSQGMAQRLGIAQAIQHRPELLILDEPTNGLDPEGSLEMWRLLRELAGEGGATVIVSSHLLHEIEEHCDRVCVMDRGHAVAQGIVAELLADPHPRLVVEFASEPQAAAAQAWLAERGWLAPPTARTDARAVVACPPGDVAPTLNRMMNEAGLCPTYVSTRKRTLRDFFLEAAPGSAERRRN